MAGSAANLGITGGLLGGLNKGEGAEALYGNSKVANAGPLANVKSNVNLSDPAAMRAEATRLQKAGHPTQALELINAANRQQRAMFTNTQNAAITASDAAAEAKAASDKGRIPEYAIMLRASDNTAPLADLLEKGDITIEDAGRAIAQDVGFQASEARAADSAARQQTAADEATEKHSWAKLAHDNTQTKLDEAKGDDAKTLEIQNGLAAEMEASTVGNTAVVNMLRSGRVLTPAFITEAEKKFREADPTSIANKQASDDAYASLTSRINGLVAAEVVDQEGFDSITAMGERLQGQPAAVIDAYAQTIGANARRLGAIPRPANGLEIDYAYSQKPAIAEILPSSFLGFGQDRQGELEAFTLQLATLTPLYASSFGVDSTIAAQSIMRMIEEGVAADPNFSAVDLSDTLANAIEIERSRVSVDIDKAARAARMKAVNGGK